jgi:polyhydroxyalkanoate synthase
MENSFMKNNFSLKGRKLDFKDIKCPVMGIAADQDDIVTLKCAEGLMEIVGSEDKSMMKKHGGHVGVITGSTAEREVWPDIYTWLSERSDRIVEKKGKQVSVK